MSGPSETFIDIANVRRERRAYERAAALAEIQACERRLTESKAAGSDSDAIKFAAARAELWRSIADEIRDLIDIQ